MATVTRLWAGTTTTWITAANWLPAAAPLLDDIVIISKGATYGIVGVSAYTSYPAGGTLTSFTLEAGNSNTIGTRDIPLNINTAILNLFGTGTVFLTGFMGAANIANGTGFNLVEVELYPPVLASLNMFSGAAKFSSGAVAPATTTGTLTAASPGVLTIASSVVHYVDGTPCQFAGITNVTGISNSVTYYLKRLAGTTPNFTYTVATTPGGTDINTGGATDTGIITVNFGFGIGVCVVAGGTLTYGEPGKTTTAITTLTLEGSGKVIYNSNQTITTLNLRKGGTLDLSGDTRAVTITTLNLSPGARIIDPNKRLTITTLTPLEGLTLSAS